MPPEQRHNENGFSQNDDGIFADPNYAWKNNNDFESWDWKQIMAAVLGGSAMPPSGGGAARIQGLIDPQTLYDASGYFANAQAVLEMLSRQVALQADALAGENGSWQGPGATSFRNMMDIFSVKLQAKAQQIAGGAAGTNSVPAQLFNSGNYLRWAQDVIRRIDNYYATWVAERGHTHNGMSTISDYGGLVEQMTNDMKRVIRILAQQYVFTASEVVQPDTTPFQDQPNIGGGGPPPGGGGPPPPGGNTGGGPPPPNLNTTGGGGGGGGEGGGGGGNRDLNPPPPPPPFDVGGGPGGGGPGGGGAGGGGPLGGGPGGGGPGPGGLGNNNLSAAPPPPPPFEVGNGPGGPGGGGGGPLGGGPGGGGPGGLGGGGGLPPPFLPGGPGGGPGGTGNNNGNNNGPGLPPPVNLGNGPGGSGGPGQNNLDENGGGGLPPPPTLAPPVNLASPPPPTGGGGPGGGGPGSPGGTGSGGGGIGGGNGVGGGNNLNVPPPPNPTDWIANGGNGPGSNLDPRGGGGMPPPMMPPPGAGGGGAGGGGGGADRPDSSGLLGGEKKPWESNVPPPAGLPGPPSGGGSQPPGSKPADWAVGGPGAGNDQQRDAPTLPPPVNLADGNVPPPAGMPAPPMMPPMSPPGAGAGAGAGGGAERPDASGLLGGEQKPWTPVGPSGSTVDVAGVEASGEPLEWSLPLGTVPPTVPPIVPPLVPPMAPPAGAAGRPESASLLGGEKQSWTTTTPDVPGPTPPAGGDSPAEQAPQPARTGIDAVPVVRVPDAKEDTSAWDVGSFGFLPLAGAVAVREREKEETAPDHVLRSSEPWEEENFQRWKPGEDSRVVEPAFYSCGPDTMPEQPEEPEQNSAQETDDAEDEEEEPERVIADLLSQDDSAWTAKGADPKGVIE